jgi:N-acetylmuramic acid 6-phosphate etherase
MQPDADFLACAAPYSKKIELVFAVDHTPTLLDIFEHIGMKLILNAISTSAAALFGRISGNYMTFLDMSNKKLIDRGSRIISELCGVSYETALKELFLAYLNVKQSGENLSPAQEAIRKLRASNT